MKFEYNPMIGLVVFITILFTYASLQPAPKVDASSLPPGVTSIN